MAMQDAEAQRQVQQMVNFIMNEAHEKAKEIEARALEDFNVEKLKLVQQMKNKVRLEYQQRAKQMGARSLAINKSRLRKIGARHTVVEEVRNVALQEMSRLSQDKEAYKRLCTDLITQALLALLENEVLVRCRKEDEAVVKECCNAAAKVYSDTIKRETNIDKQVKLTVDSKYYLPPGPTSKNDSANNCIGGVVVTTSDRRIVVDNTLDARLGLVMQQCMPAIRKTLFPVH